jgi:sulfur-oxidizing protein SoxB
MGSRISGLTHLKSGQPLEAARDYTVSGWASVNEGTEGPPVWELVEKYVARKKTVKVEPNTSVKVIGG